MPTTWLVTLSDTEKNFRRKRDAVAWLVCLTHDERPRPTVHRESAYRYVYYGAWDLMFVVRAWIDKLGFPAPRFYAVRKTRVRAEPPSINAIDPSPSAPTPGTPGPRA